MRSPQARDASAGTQTNQLDEIPRPASN